VRIPIQHDHGPTDAQVDQFVKLVKSQPADGWLHIHCTDGRGRTTTFTAIDDMMHNADKVSCEDILRRQHDIGGANLLTAQSDLDWKEQDYQERRKFIEAFYEYCQEQIPNRFTRTWSEWHAQPHK
jgi:protein-tyrosine phosphatase